jgi:predicted GIY-YIG superfamily endonuclease
MNLVGFDKWYPLDSLAVKDVPTQDKYGFVYVFRRHSTKEVLYIGSTTDLCRRFFGNYIGGVGGRTTQRIHALLFEKGAITDIDVAWKEATDHTSEEKRLRQAYFQQEGHLPIWNKQL